MADPLTLRLLRFLPRNLISRAFGGLAGLRRPRWFARALKLWFARRFELDLGEAEKPIEEYDCLLAMFTRRLRDGSRTVDEGPRVLVNPVDANVGAFGRIEGSTLLQAKGMEYGLEALLGSPERARAFENGSYATLYLSPKDYHRIHSPVGGEVVETLYEPGTLWPVNPPAVARIPQLFAVNERVSTLIEGEAGAVAVVMVGATNVGHIRLSYDSLESNQGSPRVHRRHDPALPIARADELGTFMLGSTVVLLVAGEGFAWEGLKEGEWLPLGRRIGQYSS